MRTMLRWIGPVVMVFMILSGCDEKGAWEGDYKITNMSDMRALAGYTSVTGDLIISAEKPEESILDALRLLNSMTLTSLSSLTSLTSVGGNLKIGGTFLLGDIEGLKNLTSVGGNIEISSNLSLKNMDCFRNIETVNGDLIIELNPLVESLETFSGVKSINGNLIVNMNEKLTTLGMTSLGNVGGDLVVTNNLSLPASQAESLREGLTGAEGIGGNVAITGNYDDSYPGKAYLGDFTIYRESDIKDLEGINFITGDLVIKTAVYYNPFGSFIEDQSLDSLIGLEGLVRIGGSLDIMNKDNLLSLDGLNNLTTVDGSLKIHSNGLTSLSGLERLESVGYELTIYSNAALPVADAEALRDQLLSRGGIGGNVSIMDNLGQ